jgi:hypothetical protein
MPDGALSKDQPAQAVTAQGWICPTCGLVAWHVPAEKLGTLREGLSENDLALARPGEPYERRVQILRMLRRVRRM